jgi:hypothetical protein
MKRGLLLTMTEPPAAMGEEFNAWYDGEHLPERLAIAGFRSARRWMAEVPAGEGRYLATYELDSASVLSSHEYLARFEAATPWTRRCLGTAVVFRRWACEQTDPGEADPHPLAQALLVVASDTPLDSLAVPAALQVRRFTASAGTPRHIVLAELAWPGARPPNVPQASLARIYRTYVH